MAAMTMEESFVLVNAGMANMTASIADMSQKMAAARIETEEAIKAARQDTEEAIKTARQETERVRQESDLALKESRREAEEALKAARRETERVRQETEEVIRAERRETERVRRESDLAFKEALKEARQETERLRQKTERIAQEADEAQKKLTDQLDKWIGFSGNNLGNIIELILVPGIKNKINEFGHQFNSLSPRKLYFKRDGKKFIEIDLLLENGEEVMVVEVKTRIAKESVEYHLRRLKLLRDNEAVTGMRNKILLAAVAGLQIDDDAREMASNLGMYIIEMVENDRNVNIIKPTVKMGMW